MGNKLPFNLYAHIRNLSWDLLANAHMTSLPIDIRKIADLHKLSYLIKENNSLYKNTYIVSKAILKIFGYSSRHAVCDTLAVRLMAPLIVLRDCDVDSPAEVAKMTLLPDKLAKQRYERLLCAKEVGLFELSSQERVIRVIFSDYVGSYSKNQLTHV